jgi:hypothetical protein
MEKRLKHLNHLIDKEMSKTPVFTIKDEQNILTAIKNSSSQKVGKRKKTLVPKLLTAALFAGLVFTSYNIVDKYLTTDTAIEVKKPEIRYAQEFTQASSIVTFDVKTRELTIKGTVENTTKYNSEPFQARVNILKDDVAAGLGTKSLTLDVPPKNILKPNEPYTFEKVVTLDLGIVDENTFKDAVEIEVYSDTKTLTSFVISNIEYKESPEKEPAETDLPEDQPTVPDESETATDDKKVDQDETNKTEIQTAKESLEELEKKYGKKRTPFTKVDVVSKDENYFINDITLGKTLEEILQTLGPYDDYFDTGYHSPINGIWSIESTLSDSHLSMEFTQSGKEGKVIIIRYPTLEKAYVEKWVAQLGTPFKEKPNVKFFYKEKSQQMLIVHDWGNYYEINLQYETNLGIYQ